LFLRHSCVRYRTILVFIEFLNSAKVKYMLEVVMAIRNNNMTKIPNFDPSVANHLQKIIKTMIHKGNYISVMKIKMEDLLNGKLSLSNIILS
jgi:hypothetical protein